MSTGFATPYFLVMYCCGVMFQLSAIGRCEYEKTCALLVQLFDESAQRYQELVSAGQQNNIQVAIQEGMFVTRKYIIGGPHSVFPLKRGALPFTRMCLGMSAQ